MVELYALRGTGRAKLRVEDISLAPRWIKFENASVVTREIFGEGDCAG